MMNLVLIFESDESAEEFTNGIHIPAGALLECEGLSASIGGVDFVFSLDEVTGMWGLWANVSQCAAVRALWLTYPDSPTVQWLRESQRLLRADGTGVFSTP